MKIARDTNQSMQRVRVGMIGLVVVVLLIALASAVMRSASRETPVAGSAESRGDAIANLALANQQDAGEPLAELGVAPGTTNRQAGTAR